MKQVATFARGKDAGLPGNLSKRFKWQGYFDLPELKYLAHP
jgi:hypothetical protein